MPATRVAVVPDIVARMCCTCEFFRFKKHGCCSTFTTNVMAWWASNLELLIANFYPWFNICSVCTKKCSFWRERHVLVVFHKMPYFLQLFAKNLVKTLKHGSLHKKVVSFGEMTRFGGFLCHGSPWHCCQDKTFPTDLVSSNRVPNWTSISVCDHRLVVFLRVRSNQ